MSGRRLKVYEPAPRSFVVCVCIVWLAIIGGYAAVFVEALL